MIVSQVVRSKPTNPTKIHAPYTHTHTQHKNWFIDSFPPLETRLRIFETAFLKKNKNFSGSILKNSLSRLASQNDSSFFHLFFLKKSAHTPRPTTQICVINDNDYIDKCIFQPLCEVNYAKFHQLQRIMLTGLWLHSSNALRFSQFNLTNFTCDTIFQN